MCHTRGCDLPGTCRPVLELRPRKDRPGPRVRFRDDVSMCPGHAGAATVETFLSNEGFDKLCKHLREAGKKAPPRKYVVLHWEGGVPEVQAPRTGGEVVEQPGADDDLPF